MNLELDFSARTHARAADPETSKESAARVREFAAGQCAALLAELRKADASAEQLGDALGLDAYSVRKRLADLEHAQQAEPTGETRKTRSGRAERIWRAVCQKTDSGDLPNPIG